MKRVHLFLITLSAFFMLVYSCNHEPEDILASGEICFERDVLPIFQSGCGITGCHDEVTSKSGYIYVDYASIIKSVKPYKSKDSKAYIVMTDEWSKHFMPPDKPLTLGSRKIIRMWIDQGAKNSICPDSTQYFLDSDGDSIINGTDNCPDTYNPDQLDSDEDGVGDLCDDDDNDGILDIADNCPSLYNPGQEDDDLDNIGNSCDPDYIPVGISTICFDRDVFPIILTACAIAGCHDATTAESERSYINYTNIYADIIPGDFANSKLYKVITTDPWEDDFMPPSPRPALTSDQISAIQSWIANGGLDEDCGEIPCELDNITFSGNILRIIQNNCRGCHSGDNPEGGLMLVSYDDIKSITENGKLEGTAKNLYGIVMPPDFSLTDCQIQQIDLWINAGYPNN